MIFPFATYTKGITVGGISRGRGIPRELCGTRTRKTTMRYLWRDCNAPHSMDAIEAFVRKQKDLEHGKLRWWHIMEL